ncbi:MAG: type II toxin-antitoxin system HicA family toxin [Treponema sp.]
MKDRELLKLFLKNSWREVRITGSHHILEKDKQTVSIPVHGKDMKKGLEAALLKKAGLK